MARIKLSALFQSIRGRYGGGVFRNWKGLTVLATLPDSVRNPNSDKQSAVRAILAYASKLWKDFNQATRTGWEAVAVYLTDQWDSLDNEVGTHSVIRTPRGPYTALGALTSVCSLLATVDAFDVGDPAPAAPVSHTAPTQVTDVALSGDTDGIVVTFVDPADWGDLEEDGLVRIWCKSDDGVFFPQLVFAVASGQLTGTITMLVPRGGDRLIPLEAGFYYVQMDAVNDGGLRSAPSNIATIQIDLPVPP